MNHPAVFDRNCFTGKVVAVTGAAQGLGRSMAELLSSLGASVLLIDHQADPILTIASAIGKRGGDALAVQADIGRLEDLEASVAACQKRWGVIHGWVNNAAINQRHLVHEQADEEFLRVWQVNTHAAWRAVKLCLPLMSQEGGAIVNISSIMSVRTVPKSVAYTSSKAGLEGLTRALAIELAPRRIRVNAILPGYIPVEGDLGKRAAPRPFLQPWPAQGRPDDVAHAAVFLLSPAASFITGATVVVDGGLVCEMKPA